MNEIISTFVKLEEEEKGVLVCDLCFDKLAIKKCPYCGIVVCEKCKS